jgi:ribosome-associated protein
MPQEFQEQVRAICACLHDKKAQDILALHVADKTIVADWFILCSGRSGTQVKALCDELEEKAPSLDLSCRRREGYAEGRWIVLDFGIILVHIFHPEERVFYHLERLWDDGRNLIRYPEESHE